jgi:hypothetical protein
MHTCVWIHCHIKIDVRIAQRAPCHSVAANPDTVYWAMLQRTEHVNGQFTGSSMELVLAQRSAVRDRCAGRAHYGAASTYLTEQLEQVGFLDILVKVAHVQGRILRGALHWIGNRRSSHCACFGGLHGGSFNGRHIIQI